MIEEPEPVADALLDHRMHGHVADVGQSHRAPGQPFARLGVVARVVSDRLLGIAPGVPLLPVDDERFHDAVGVVRLDQRATPEAFDLH